LSDNTPQEGKAFAMEWKSNVWKGLVTTASLCIFCCALFLGYYEQTAEARAEVRVAEREMKKSRDYQGGGAIYERARRIIYGMNPPSGPEGRVRIAIVIDGDEDLIVEDRVKDEIYTQICHKFPREEFAVMKGTDVMTKLLQYEEDKGYSEWSNSTTEWRNTDGDSGQNVNRAARSLDKDGLNIQRQQPNGISFVSREDFVRAGRACDYDYIFAVTVSHGNYYEESHPWFPIIPPLLNATSTTMKKSIWLRVRFVDMASGDYLYRRDVVAYGETGGHFTGRARKFQWGVRKALEEVLDDIEIKY
jgi:hypothetical protein